MTLFQWFPVEGKVNLEGSRQLKVAVSRIAQYATDRCTHCLVPHFDSPRRLGGAHTTGFAPAIQRPWQQCTKEDVHVVLCLQGLRSTNADVRMEVCM
jgi:hypothetical protein